VMGLPVTKLSITAGAHEIYLKGKISW